MNTKKILTLDDYQWEARKTAIYPHIGSNLIYTVLGLAGEAGELANKVKKLMRSAGLEPGMNMAQLYGNIEKIQDAKVRQKMFKNYFALKGELGGVLWYVALTASELGETFNFIGIDNLDDLSGRVKKGNVEGEGDDRGKKD